MKTLYRLSHSFLGFGADTKNIFLELDGSGKVLYFSFGEEYSPYYMDVPDGQEIVPHTWTFICITFDNDEKDLGVYLNSNKISKKTEENDMENFRFEKDFLARNIKFEVSWYSGNITNLNIWSSILTKEQIIRLFQCKQEYPKPDLLEWGNMQLNIKPETKNDDSGRRSCAV